MNTATQNLENDHVYILRLTNIMEAMVQQNANQVAHFETVIKLIKEFADGLHHNKEENLLFPKMEQKGFSPNAGPVSVMLYEHTQGRGFVKQMVEALQQHKQGQTQAIDTLYKAMLNYVGLLRNHIHKEDNILFRMADNVLSEAEQIELLEKFQQIDSDTSKKQSSTDYINEVQKLAKMYNC